MVFTQSLKENRDFRAMYARGKNAVGVYLVVYSRKNRTGINRLGLTVSAKLGGAVVRNRIRRRVKEAYRLSEPSIKKGFDIVIAAKGASRGANFVLLRDELMRLCKKLRVADETENGSLPAGTKPFLPSGGNSGLS